jgi:hypothetical protein
MCHVSVLLTSIARLALEALCSKACLPLSSSLPQAAVDWRGCPPFTLFIYSWPTISTDSQVSLRSDDAEDRDTAQPVAPASSQPPGKRARGEQLPKLTQMDGAIDYFAIPTPAVCLSQPPPSQDLWAAREGVATPRVIADHTVPEVDNTARVDENDFAW